MTQENNALSRRHLLTAIASAVLCANTNAWAQSDRYPNKPIRLVVGYAPGGSVDMTARIVADVLTSKLSATVVVENMSGAAGTLAAQRVVSSPADGYTLLLGSSNEMAATGLVNPAQKYDPLRDLTPISMIATGPLLLVAGAKTGVKNLDGFLVKVKNQPGRFSYGSSGVGSTLHFAGELIKQRAGVFMTHIPYRSTASLTSDLAGGSIEFAIMSIPAAMPFIQSGRITALGITSARRFPSLPQVPALAEHTLLKDYDLTGWYALAGPRELPADVVQRLRSAIQLGLKEASIHKRLEDGGSYTASGQENLATIMRADMARYAQLVKFAHITD